MKTWFRQIVPILFLCVIAGCATGSGGAGTKKQKKAEAFRQLGEAFLGAQNYTMALSEFLKAEKLDSDDHILQWDLGLAFMAKGDPETAVHRFQKALEIKPDYAPARNNLGAAYLAMGDWDSAIACFKLVTEDLLYATPHYPLTNLGRAYYEKKDYSEAVKYYQKAISMKPNFVNALYGLGKTYLALGEVQKAAEVLEQAVEAAPQLAEAHFELATVYRLLGDEVKAKNEYEQVVTLAPGGDLAREAKQELYRRN